MSNWKCVQDRLPEVGKDVLVYDHGRYEVSSLYEIGSKKHPCLSWEVNYCMNPTHWIELPKAPNDSN